VLRVGVIGVTQGSVLGRVVVVTMFVDGVFLPLKLSKLLLLLGPSKLLLLLPLSSLLWLMLGTSGCHLQFGSRRALDNILNNSNK
jgi:hypothetical protein